jgi:hypothetical protein
MANHLQRIEAVEKELKRLSSTSAVKEDVTKLRTEMKQVYVSFTLQQPGFFVQEPAMTA